MAGRTAVGAAWAVALAVATPASAQQAAGAANTAPVVTIHVAGNRTFLWPGKPLPYQVVVSDAEDGDTVAGTIAPSGVAVTFAPMASGWRTFRPPAIAPDALAGLVRGAALVAASDCVLCHVPTGQQQAIPSFSMVAETYQGDAGAPARLAAKIRAGGKGVWGDRPMPPHPGLSVEDATAIARHVLSFAGPAHGAKWLPARGSVAAENGFHGEGGSGRYVLAASYTDRGVPGGAPRTGSAVLLLRPPSLPARARDGERGIVDAAAPGGGAFAVAKQRRAFIRFAGIDLTDVRALAFTVGDSAADWAGGTIEIRLASPIGRVIGRAAVRPAGAAGSVRTVEVPIEPTRGVQDLHLVFRGGARSRRGSVALAAVAFLD